MAEELKIKHLELAYDLINNMCHDEFAYIFNGFFNEKVSSGLLALTERNLKKTETSVTIKKRVFFILIETLQNITRHQSKDKHDHPFGTGIFIIQKRKDHFLVTTGNVIAEDSGKELVKMIDEVNRLTKEELNEMYQDRLIHGTISKKGGAGLGLITMARKTGQKYTYMIEQIDQNRSFFYMQLAVPQNHNTEKDFLQGGNYNLSRVKSLHQILSKQKVLLNFNGSFNNDNIGVLLPIIKEHMSSDYQVEKKLFSVMMEMLQNIVKYADPSDEEVHANMDGNPGVFFLSQGPNDFYLTASNFIDISKISKLQRKLDFVNFLPRERLDDFYQQISDYFEHGEINKPDLSIIQMRLLSEHDLKYSFKPVSETRQFFTLQASISKFM